jgi:hypothetical protein
MEYALIALPMRRAPCRSPKASGLHRAASKRVVREGLPSGCESSRQQQLATERGSQRDRWLVSSGNEKSRDLGNARAKKARKQQSWLSIHRAVKLLIDPLHVLVRARVYRTVGSVLIWILMFKLGHYLMYRFLDSSNEDKRTSRSAASSQMSSSNSRAYFRFNALYLNPRGSKLVS